MGECIKRNREKKDISIEELAQKTGIDESLILSYEAGATKPTYRDLERISKELDVPMVMLAHGGGTMRKRHKDEEGKCICEVEEY